MKHHLRPGRLVAFYPDGGLQSALACQVMRIIDEETLELEVVWPTTMVNPPPQKQIAKRATKHPRPPCSWDLIV